MGGFSSPTSPNDRIHVWDEQEGISLWLEGTGRSNGMDFNQDGELVACADLHNRLVVFNDQKEMRILCENYNGKHLNGPNDVWVATSGDSYFTDPYYHRNYWEEGHHEVQDARGVYHFSTDGKVSRVSDQYVQPNGIIGTPDGKTLYVATSTTGRYGNMTYKRMGAFRTEPFRAGRIRRDDHR